MPCIGVGRYAVDTPLVGRMEVLSQQPERLARARGVPAEAFRPMASVSLG